MELLRARERIRRKIKEKKMAEEKMRVTAHNGRAGKHGAYSAKHNDRRFDTSKADHIDEERSKDNWYWHRYQGHKEWSFEQAEAHFYERHFREALDTKNQKAIDCGHRGRVKSMDDYRASVKSCPEEQLMLIGKEGQTVDPKVLWDICIEQIKWERAMFPQFEIIDLALHMDEEGAPHMHKRGAWVCHDEDGREMIGQAKALEEMGVERPDPAKPSGKKNNAKMTYTAMCREHLFDLCEERGLEVEREPREASQSGLNLLEYKARREREKLAELQAENERLQAENSSKQSEIDRQVEEIGQQRAELRHLRTEIVSTGESALKVKETLKEAQTALDKIPDKREELAVIEKQIKEGNRELEKIIDLKAKATVIHKPFGDRDTVTYHRNTLEDVRALGSQVHKERLEIYDEKKKMSKREAVVEEKERRIDPLYEDAKEKQKQADEYLKEQRDYIYGTASEIASKRFERFIRERFREDTGDSREKRLEALCETIQLQDGRTVLQFFDDKEAEREEKIQKAWNLEKQDKDDWLAR